MKVVVNARNGARDFECDPGQKILHAGLRSGVELSCECATGTCGTCKAKLVSGRAESEWPDAPGHRYLKSEAELLKEFSVDGTNVLMVHTGDAFVAYQAMCPHEAFPLEEGIHDGSVLTGLTGYGLKDEGGELYVALEGPSGP